jgi:hypothetical protein
MPDEITSTLRKALARLQTERERIDRQITAIQSVIGSADGRAASAGRRRPMSAAARRAVSRRMKKYWADRRSARGGAKGPKAKPAKAEKAPAK